MKMKKIMFTLAATVLMTGILFTSCNSTSRKIENAGDKVLDAKEAVVDAKIDLTLARQDSISEFQQFKTDYQNQISTNEKTIAGLKLSIADASRENKVQFEEKLALLEKRNNELKIKLAEYKADETDQWKAFKQEFKNDMDELGDAFSNFTVSSKN
jgi:preprotein translocase subunit SecF